MKQIFLIPALLCTTMSMGAEAPKTWKAGVTPKTFATGLKRNAALRQSGTIISMKDINVPVPDHFDWREIPPGLTPVKDQGDCGSCWAFGTTAVLESALKLRGMSHMLSEQFLVSCDKNFDGCSGGDIAFDMFVNPGSVSEKQFPYSASDEACKPNLKYGPKVLKWAYVDGNNNDVPAGADIAKAIFLYGPVAVGIAADVDFMSYESGVFNTCNSTDVAEVNHLVTLVGYDIPGQYWILRNSWGKDWGEQGYMRIKWGCDVVGDEAAFISFINPFPTP